MEFWFLMFFIYLFANIGNAVSINTKSRVSLGQARRIVDLADALLSLALAEGEASLGGVRHDVAADGLLVVAGEHGRVGVGDDLVGDDDGAGVLLGEILEAAE